MLLAAAFLLIKPGLVTDAIGFTLLAVAYASGRFLQGKSVSAAEAVAVVEPRSDG